ncbi:MAG: SigB/SigF/SigG family RNA polymerase sigma factor [Acidimicrobiales bacterium]
MAERDEQRRRELFEELASTGSVEIRNELVESYAPLAEFFANRYKQRATDNDDLRQVAQLALVKAVDRFDPAQGAAFSTFAGRTIDGELKRHFRDRTWAVRVPRGLQEAALEVRNAADELALGNGRAPTVEELAEHTGYETDMVLQALDVRSAQRAASIDRPADDDEGANPIATTLGVTDANFGRTEAGLAVRALMAELPKRERRIVELRFYGELTQQQIADRMGISQMHVSRLLRAALEAMRERADS